MHNWQRHSSLTFPHSEQHFPGLFISLLPTLSTDQGHRESSQTPLNVFPRVPGSLSGLLVVVPLFSTPTGVLGETGGWDARLCSWAPKLERDALWQTDSTSRSRSATGSLGAAAEEDWEEEEGVGGR